MRLLAEEFLDKVLHGRHARLSADQYDLVDVRGGNLGVFERRQARTLRAFDKFVDELLELGARERDVEMLGAGGVCRHERKIYVGRL